MDKQASKEDIIRRLKTLKGHVAGIEKMVSEDKPCEDILLQITAIKSAMNKIGNIIVENHALDCLINSDDEIDKEKAKKIIKALINYTK